MAQDMSEKADVQVGLAGSGGDRRFVIQNVGGATARDVRFEVRAEQGKNSPVMSSEINQLFPVDELPPEEARTVSATVTTGTGIHFLATVSWQDDEGTRQQQSFQLMV